jgi:hypothetical protein
MCLVNIEDAERDLHFLQDSIKKEPNEVLHPSLGRRKNVGYFSSYTEYRQDTYYEKGHGKSPFLLILDQIKSFEILFLP